MTNFEHMTDKEKKNAIMYGMHITKDGEYKACATTYCEECKISDKCMDLIGYEDPGAIKDWFDAEYVPPKTENEKFCETLKKGEVIVVWNNNKTQPRVRVFQCYDKETDSITCLAEGFLDAIASWIPFKYGRKLKAEEKGE